MLYTVDHMVTAVPTADLAHCTLGCSCLLTPSIIAVTPATSDGVVFFFLGVKLTLSALIDGKNFSAGGHKVGLGFELEA